MKVAITTRATYFKNKAKLLPLLDALSLRGKYGVTELNSRGIEFFEPTKDNLLHFGDFTCDDFPVNAKHPMIAFALKTPAIKYISFHVGVATTNWKFDPSIDNERSVGTILTKQQIVKLASERIPQLKKLFNGAIAAENMPNHLNPVQAHVCEPEFISKIIKRYKLKFLFDISHAQVSAHNMGYSVKNYIDALPLDKTIEVHIAKPGIVNGKWKDLHGIPGKEQYDLLSYVKERADVSYVTYEYVGDEPLDVLVSVIKKLKRF